MTRLDWGEAWTKRCAGEGGTHHPFIITSLEQNRHKFDFYTINYAFQEIYIFAFIFVSPERVMVRIVFKERRRVLWISLQKRRSGLFPDGRKLVKHFCWILHDNACPQMYREAREALLGLKYSDPFFKRWIEILPAFHPNHFYWGRVGDVLQSSQ